METEYAATRLSALRSRLPSAPELIRILEMAEVTSVAEVLRWSAYSEDMETMAAHGDAKMDPPKMFRVISEGNARLRAKFGEFVRTADETLAEVLLMKWEVEEVKSALRYLAFDGFDLDRRFSFASLILKPGAIPAWGSYRSAPEFVSVMRKGGHPLAPALNAKMFANDPADGELAISRYFYHEYLPAKASGFPEAVEYHLCALDSANTLTAALLRDAPSNKKESLAKLITGLGAVTAEDLNTIVNGSGPEALSVVEKRMGIKLKRGAETSPMILSMGIRRQLFHRYWKRSLLEPTGVWSFIYFMEALDANAANLKLAISFAASHTPVGEAAESFIRV